MLPGQNAAIFQEFWQKNRAHYRSGNFIAFLMQKAAESGNSTIVQFLEKEGAMKVCL